MAQGIYADENGNPRTETLSLPYGFYNEAFGFAGAWVYARLGFPQPQAAVLGTVMAGTNGSAMGVFMARDLRAPGLDRLFVDAIASVGYSSEAEAFVDGNPRFPHERAGSHTSNRDDFLDGEGWDNYARVRLKYLLPIGHARHEILTTYEFDRGILVGGATGGTSWWNPWRSGRTYLELRPFYRSQEINNDAAKIELQTNGADFSVFWDNRDFPANPSTGHALSLKASRDFGWFDSSGSWTALQAELDKYVSLGESPWFRQRVVAFDLWTAYSPSWEERDGRIHHGAPAYTGATLGGIWRLRGYPSQRFSDKAAIYYGLEFRMIPRWNPFERWPWLQRHLGVQWIQVAPFAEAGRVAREWNLAELHSGLKWDVGLGVRLALKGFVVRADTAVSEEGLGVQMMISQPFQF